MKKFIVLVNALFISVVAFAHTINWHVGNQIISTTTCSSGDNITPPSAPAKLGYHFKEWTNIPVGYYTRLEYVGRINPTGTEYIDTGIVPTLNIRTYIEMAFVDSSYNNGIFGVDWVSESPLLIGMGNGKLRWHLVSGNGIDTNSDVAVGNKFTVEAANGYLKVNNNEYSGTPLSTFSTANTLKLFYKGTYTSKIKVYSFKIYDNGTLVRNFIPAKRTSDNAIGMYDTVSETFFTNAGTGAFNAGPEVGALQ